MLDKLDIFEKQVRVRAFALWEESGCPENRADEFWHRAYEIEKQNYDLSESDLAAVEQEHSGKPEDFA